MLCPLLSFALSPPSRKSPETLPTRPEHPGREPRGADSPPALSEQELPGAQHPSESRLYWANSEHYRNFQFFSSSFAPLPKFLFHTRRAEPSDPAAKCRHRSHERMGWGAVSGWGGLVFCRYKAQPQHKSKPKQKATPCGIGGEGALGGLDPISAVRLGRGCSRGSSSASQSCAHRSWLSAFKGLFLPVDPLQGQAFVFLT